MDILNFLFKIKEMNKHKAEYKEPIIFYTGATEYKLGELLRHQNDFNCKTIRNRFGKEYLDIGNINCNEFDFRYQLLKSLLTNIHHCNDDLFAKIINCSTATKGENYVMFLLAKHGDTQLISKVIKMREKD